MTRLLTPLAVVALLALGVVLALLVIRPSPSVSPAEQAAQIAAELRCPDCQALSVAESQTAAAQAIRQEIAEQLAAGRTPDEVRQHFVDRYGEWILLQPADPLIWLLPAAALLLGVAAFGWWLRRSLEGRRRGAQEEASVSDEERQRVRDELEALDG
jgi:cytochrome c-type biogenesis protein CcmH